jgi:hypothetical protein
MNCPLGNVPVPLSVLRKRTYFADKSSDMLSPSKEHFSRLFSSYRNAHITPCKSIRPSLSSLMCAKSEL